MFENSLEEKRYGLDDAIWTLKKAHKDMNLSFNKTAVLRSIYAKNANQMFLDPSFDSSYSFLERFQILIARWRHSLFKESKVKQSKTSETIVINKS